MPFKDELLARLPELVIGTLAGRLGGPQAVGDFQGGLMRRRQYEDDRAQQQAAAARQAQLDEERRNQQQQDLMLRSDTATRDREQQDFSRRNALFEAILKSEADPTALAQLYGVPSEQVQMMAAPIISQKNAKAIRALAKSAVDDIEKRFGGDKEIMSGVKPLYFQKSELLDKLSPDYQQAYQKQNGLSLQQFRELSELQATAPTGEAIPPMPVTTVRAPAAPGTFEHYVDASPEEQARIEAARKRFMQSDDPQRAVTDPEIADLRKELLRLQVERAGDEKEPNQGQFTAATYAGRMEQAERTFGGVQNDIVAMSLPSFELQTNSWFARPTFQSAAVQSYMQAARNFINAVLRRESGAVISPSEFAEARQQYLPQPGDKPEISAQKAANRQYVFETMKRAAGRAYEAPPIVYPPLTQEATVGGTYIHNGKKVKVRAKTRTGFLFDEVTE